MKSASSPKAEYEGDGLARQENYVIQLFKFV